MNQFRFNQEEEESAKTEHKGMQSFNEATQDIVSIIVRLSGLVLLFIGLWIAIQVFHEALSLYKDPGNIERVAIAIESGSNIDKSIAIEVTRINGIRISTHIGVNIDTSGKSRLRTSGDALRLSSNLAIRYC